MCISIFHYDVIKDSSVAVQNTAEYSDKRIRFILKNKVMQTIKSLSKLQGKLMKALAVIAEWWAMPSITLNKARQHNSQWQNSDEKYCNNV